MDLRPITSQQKSAYNSKVTHVMQSWEWGEFRLKLGLPLKRYGIYKAGKLVCAFQLTFHKIPLTKLFVGYLPKGPAPDKALYEALAIIGQQERCAFIKIEPNIITQATPYQVYPKFLRSPKPLFTKHNFIWDLQPTEDQLLAQMHAKTRYNIKVAQKHQVEVVVREDDQALQIYLDLHFATTKRQGFMSHTPSYHQKVWSTLKAAGMARLLIAFYTPPGKKKPLPLTAWMLLRFKDTLYYPYGGSSDQYKETMASTLVAWEAAKLGKRLNCKYLDLWGSLGPDPNRHDSFYGFHRFKAGFGATLVEYLGTFDLVFNPTIYYAFNLVDRFTRLKLLLLNFRR